MPAKSTDAIDEALGEIAKRQHYDGSFGYWQDDPEGHLWLTAYSLLALEQGSKAGYFVPKRLRDQAANYLSSQLDRLTGASEVSSARAQRLNRRRFRRRAREPSSIRRCVR